MIRIQLSSYYFPRFQETFYCVKISDSNQVATIWSLDLENSGCLQNNLIKSKKNYLIIRITSHRLEN